MLQEIGAIVVGFSTPTPFEPSIYVDGGLSDRIEQILGDVRDLKALEIALQESDPDYIVHLAAQPIVLSGYKEPYETFQANALGTLNLLEAHRRTRSKSRIIVVTTDKVYKNDYSHRAFSEQDPLGGFDPYGASKVAAEMVVSGYRALDEFKNKIAVVRGGNILGGGDWSPNRIVPDFVRAVTSGKVLKIRHPDAVRPWQHVLDLAGGYLHILEMFESGHDSLAAQDWNIGPEASEEMPVRDVLELMQKHWMPAIIEQETSNQKEALTLLIDSKKARTMLGWYPRLSTLETIEWTASWYRDYYDRNKSATEITLDQIRTWLAR
jgi:CDP-glucose 4,6-dehydratase